MKLAGLCDYIEGLQYYGSRDFGREITGIACNSREVKPGSLFVAISGTRADGHDFIHDALSRGAVAVVTEKMVHLPENIPHIVVRSSAIALAQLASGFYGVPSKGLKIIGVTGTNGKTTTAYLLHSMLRASGKKVGLLGTIHYKVGDRLVKSTQTTPSPIELHRLFREMLDQGTTHVVMEVSSHALAQERTHGIEFQGAIFTNLTMDHLDYHLNLSNYREAKTKLFRNLPRGAFAVLNRDDYTSLYLSLDTRAGIFWYGLGNGSGIRAELLDAYLGGMDMKLCSEQEEVVVSTRLMGSHNIYNILAASTAAVALGVSLEDVKGGIESLDLVPGRLERVMTGNGVAVFVDYAHTPDALEAALAALRPLVKNRLLLVFGCGGDRDKGKRPLMGHIGEKYSECLWITSDNPRTEQPISIIKDIEKGMSGSAYWVEPDRKRAIEDAVSGAREGDVVLIAGKGHEGTQVFADRTIPFDDREVVREVLTKISRVHNTAGEGVLSGNEKVRIGVSLA